MDRRQLYAEISKVEPQSDGTLKVYGYASSEAVDADGEVITSEAMKAALPDYLKFGAVREMHQPLAAGTAIEARVEDDGRTWFGAHVVDPIAVKKVETKVYKGFSIGGKITGRQEDDKNIITGLKLVEISLVDRPANPEAVFTMYKVEDAKEEPPTPVTEPPKEEPAAKADDATELVVTGTDDEVAEFAKALNDSGLTMADAIAAVKAAAVVKAAPAAPPAPASDEAKKGLYDIGLFADCLLSLAMISANAQDEAAWEDDDSPIPANMREWLAQGAGIFSAMAAEESTELVGRLKELAGDDASSMVAMAASGRAIKTLAAELAGADNKALGARAIDVLGFDGLSEVVGKGGKADEMRKAIVDAILAKAKMTNAERAQQIHKIACDMGAKCAKDDDDTDMSSAAGTGDLTKVNKLEATVATLTEEVSKLKKQPMPTRVALRAVAKADDLPDGAEAKPVFGEEQYVRKADGTIDAAATVIKFTQQFGGVPALPGATR